MVFGVGCTTESVVGTAGDTSWCEVIRVEEFVEAEPDSRTSDEKRGPSVQIGVISLDN